MSWLCHPDRDFILDLHIIMRRCCHQHVNIVTAAAFTIAPLHFSVLYDISENYILHAKAAHTVSASILASQVLLMQLIDR